MLFFAGLAKGSTVSLWRCWPRRAEEDICYRNLPKLSAIACGLECAFGFSAFDDGGLLMGLSGPQNCVGSMSDALGLRARISARSH